MVYLLAINQIACSPSAASVCVRSNRLRMLMIFLFLSLTCLSVCLCVAGEVLLEWEGLTAKITRPDVRAVNGVIHVIDAVLMKKRDMTTSASTALHATPVALLLAFALLTRTLGGFA